MVQVQKKGLPQAIGCWRGGLTTKIHLAVDALGNPLRSILTAGQDSDIIQAPALIQGLDPDMVVIPVRSNRNQQREYDHHWYKAETWWSVSSIKLNSFAVLPRAMKSLIATSCLCST